jgi:formylmethanofuran dehydrogenase subunit B
MSERTIENVACTVCACICDDLKVTVRDGVITAAEHACCLAEPWYLSPWTSTAPSVQVRGHEATFQQGVEAAAEILRDARAPLIFGLSKSSTEGQRAAVALADKLGATIDTTASEGHAPSILALQQVGESTCSLGEIRNRADFVIYWGADPITSHPRHMERYSIDASGMLTPNGRADRTLVVVDSASSKTGDGADWFLKIDSGSDFDVLWTLRGLLQGVEPNPGQTVGAPLEELKRLAEMMKHCRCGVIFFGYGVAQHPMGHRNVEALLRLVIDLNQFTRFHARRLRNVGDVSGADSVLCWQTGYPFSVNLARGYPRYNPDEYSAGDVLENKEADALILVGTARVDSFSPAAQDHLRGIPTIVLDGINAKLPLQPTVLFTTATYGIHIPGTAYRMDEIPIRLRPLIDTNLPSDGDVLRAIQAAL